jgi:acetyltransferase
MPTQNLNKLFQPHSVAVLGASAKSGSVGRTLLENLQRESAGKQVYPINPKYNTLLGITAYPSISALNATPDLAVVATPAATVPGLVRECGAAGVLGMIILSAGFSEVGPHGKDLERELERAASEFPQMRIIGPNCLGVMVPGSHLNASFAAGMAKPGRVAFISQSGALCTSILDWSLSEGIGFSYFVSIGNALNVKVGDLIDYLAEDPTTDSIVLYLESVREARRFMSAARAFTRTKPIVVYKAGRFAESAQAAASHTGAMAGVDAVYEAAFQRAGMVRIYRAEDMFDCAELLARQRTPVGPRLAIITNAGGPGVMAADELLARKGGLAKLAPETIAALNSVLPEHWSRQNPVDVLGDARPDRFATALEILVKDSNVDGVLIILTPQAMTDPIGTAIRVADIAATTRAPVLAAWMGGHSVEPGRQILNQAGIPTYDSPDRAVRAFMYLVSYRHNREILYETPRQIPLIKLDIGRAAHQPIKDAIADRRNTLTEIEAKSMLSAYGIPTTVPRPAPTSADAVRIATGLGYPVVMKIDSPQISHKTEVRGVRLGIASDEEVRHVFDEIIERAKKMRPDAQISGVTLQPMLTSADGVELIVGAKQDPVFGAVMMVGAGGITAEVLEDRSLELPPLNERLARRMLDSLRIRPLLYGFRGRPAVNIDRLVEVLMRFSYLIAENPEIAELDVNPMLVTSESVTALDARVIVRPSESCRPYSHLAIRPYPEEYIRSVTLKDGTHMRLRPIRPEDEPHWHQFMHNCSARSLWLRFRYLFKETTHEMAARFCFVDYDRTMAIVAEIEDGGEPQIIGVARLVADADHKNTEYAVLVADAWQGRGLGSILTDFSLEICTSWGIDRIYCETTNDNNRMQSILMRRGFDLLRDGQGEQLFALRRSDSSAATNC